MHRVPWPWFQACATCVDLRHRCISPKPNVLRRQALSFDFAALLSSMHLDNGRTSHGTSRSENVTVLPLVITPVITDGWLRLRAPARCHRSCNPHPPTLATTQTQPRPPLVQTLLTNSHQAGKVEHRGHPTKEVDTSKTDVIRQTNQPRTNTTKSHRTPQWQHTPATAQAANTTAHPCCEPKTAANSGTECPLNPKTPKRHRHERHSPTPTTHNGQGRF